MRGLGFSVAGIPGATGMPALISRRVEPTPWSGQRRAALHCMHNILNFSYLTALQSASTYFISKTLDRVKHKTLGEGPPRIRGLRRADHTGELARWGCTSDADLCYVHLHC